MRRARLVLLFFFGGTFSYPFYRNAIPNGNNVKNPCNRNADWQGVGHTDPTGGGQRNPFGEDFFTYGRTWNPQLCKEDSDQDGRTNGEELGDPSCLWSAGQPAPAVNVTHPGVCEPLESDHCKSVQSFNCGGSGGGIFEKCPELAEPHVQKINMTFPKWDVPDQETNYFCKIYKLPTDKAYQAIAFEPIIDCVAVLHHMLVFGCPDDVEETEPVRCGMTMAGCPDLINVWGLGLSGHCLNKKVGINFGSFGYKYIAIQLHWNNPLRTPGYKDASGFRVYYTDQLRRYSEQIALFGQETLDIPPLTAETIRTSTCPKSCTSQIPNPRNITAAIIHMHYLGYRGKVEQWRDGHMLRVLVQDDAFDYDNPVRHEFDPPLDFLPGDEIKTICYYNSKDGKRRRETVTPWGSDTKREMCYSFLNYYPGNPAIPSYYCVSRDGNTVCRDGIAEQDCDPCDEYATLMEANEIMRQTGMCKRKECTTDCYGNLKEYFGSSCAMSAITHLAADPMRHYFEPLVTSAFACPDVASGNVTGLINAVSSMPRASQCPRLFIVYQQNGTLRSFNCTLSLCMLTILVNFFVGLS